MIKSRKRKEKKYPRRKWFVFAIPCLWHPLIGKKVQGTFYGDPDPVGICKEVHWNFTLWLLWMRLGQLKKIGNGRLPVFMYILDNGCRTFFAKEVK